MVRKAAIVLALKKVLADSSRRAELYNSQPTATRQNSNQSFGLGPTRSARKSRSAVGQPESGSQPTSIRLERAPMGWRPGAELTSGWLHSSWRTLEGTVLPKS